MSSVHIVYLHGFLSSSQAFKAQQLRDYIQGLQLAAIFHCPELPNKPSQALLFIDDFLAQLSDKPVALVGSSLGGFYAQYFAAKLSCKAVLINPVVNITDRLHLYMGPHQNPYTQKTFIIDQGDLDATNAAQKSMVDISENLMVLLQMGDEVLDASHASQRFYQSKCIIEPKGAHQFQTFERFLPMACQWLL